MILIISTCRERLHELEFVRPVGDILGKEGVAFRILHYSKLTPRGLEGYEKAIICGTSLKDNRFLDDIGRFQWLRDSERPVLGICSGLQIIGLAFGGKLEKRTEIGFYRESFRGFLGLRGRHEVYHLHNNYIDFRGLPEFDILNTSGIPQAVRHKHLPLYGALFHPEVRNREVILNFALDNEGKCRR